MDSKAELLKWQKYFEDHKVIAKELTKYQDIDLSATNFFHPCQVINKRICAEIGVGLNKINSLTVRNFLALLVEYVHNLEEQDLILLAADGSEEAQELIKAATHLKLNKGQFVVFENFEAFDKKFVGETIKRIKAKCGFFIQSSIYDAKLVEIFFLNYMGEYYDDEFVNKINQNAIENDYFNLELTNEPELYYIENDKMIKIFVDKIQQLYTKRLSTKLTKIAISNHNAGVTKILAKLVGHLDYAYVINPQPKKQHFFESKILDDHEIKSLYKKEIRFARKNRCNILITFDQSGSQLLIFLLQRKNIIFLNENLIALIFLHNFYNNLFLANKKLAKSSIASDCPPMQSVANLISKYKLEFHVIDQVVYDPQNYMLFYWNSYHQFIFGEKRNVHFGIYNTTIKLLEIINFALLQNGGLQHLIGNINMMYDPFVQIQWISDLNFHHLEQKINALIKQPQLHELYKINFIKAYSETSKNEEQLLWTIAFANHNQLIIRQNILVDKIILAYRFQAGSKKLFWNYKWQRREAKKLLKEIIY